MGSKWKRNWRCWLGMHEWVERKERMVWNRRTRYWGCAREGCRAAALEREGGVD